MKREVSFDNYIAMCDRFAELPFQANGWWPSITDIQTRIEPKIEQHLEFLIWLSETAGTPKTPAQEESKKYIEELLKKTLVFIDDAPATAGKGAK